MTKITRIRPLTIILVSMLWIGVTQELWSEMPSVYALPSQEIDSLSEDTTQTLDFKSCLQNPEGPRAEIKVSEIKETSPELLLGRKYTFSTSVKSSRPLLTASALTYRWTILPPVESQVGEYPRYATDFELKPDRPGTYRIRLALFKQNQLCDFKEYTIEVPDVSQQHSKRLIFVKRPSRLAALLDSKSAIF